MTSSTPDVSEDIAVFARQVMRRPLWPHQEEAARSEAFITTIAKARRTGGTSMIETLAAFTCLREPDVTAVILSAGQEASRRVTQGLAAELNRSPLTRGAVVDDFATRLRLDNNSQVISLPASQRAVRGLGRRVKLLGIDECGFVEDPLWRAARYVALDERARGARILLVGTPWGDGFFRREYQAGLDGEPDHASFHWPYTVNPLLDHAYLERERERTSVPEYQSEVLGLWSDSVGSVFSRELLDAHAGDLEVAVPW